MPKPRSQRAAFRAAEAPPTFAYPSHPKEETTSVSEFRQNYATKEWVIIAGNRGSRPCDFSRESKPPRDLPAQRSDCPFCPGNEAVTGRETFRMGNTADWVVRAVENKYSALNLSHSTHRKPNGLFLKADSYGTAEVVIETPVHNASLVSLSVAEIENVLQAYLSRTTEIGTLPNIAIITIFRNYGHGAGTSLEHPHSQIIASPIIPPHIRDPIHKAALHYDSYGSCVYCDIIAEERRQTERVVYENDHFIAFCPFASRTPYELRIYPKRHVASYTWITPDEIHAFADALKIVLAATRNCLADPDYNFIIRSAPIGDEDVRYLHWYFVLIPKISTPAGFEIGSGIYINSVAPEDAAEQLRKEGVEPLLTPHS